MFMLTTDVVIGMMSGESRDISAAEDRKGERAGEEDEERQPREGDHAADVPEPDRRQRAARPQHGGLERPRLAHRPESQGHHQTHRLASKAVTAAVGDRGREEPTATAAATSASAATDRGLADGAGEPSGSDGVRWG